MARAHMFTSCEGIIPFLSHCYLSGIGNCDQYLSRSMEGVDGFFPLLPMKGSIFINVSVLNTLTFLRLGA